MPKQLWTSSHPQRLPLEFIKGLGKVPVGLSISQDQNQAPVAYKSEPALGLGFTLMKGGIQMHREFVVKALFFYLTYFFVDPSLAFPLTINMSIQLAKTVFLKFFLFGLIV